MEAVVTSAVTERRQQRRHDRRTHAIVWARIRPGYDVEVVNVSATGALLESRHRLLPGAAVELQLRRYLNEQASMRGCILRSVVCRLAASEVRYRGAIVFNAPLAWFVEGASDGYSIPVHETPLDRTDRAEATRVERGPRRILTI